MVHCIVMHNVCHSVYLDTLITTADEEAKGKTKANLGDIL